MQTEKSFFSCILAAMTEVFTTLDLPARQMAQEVVAPFVKVRVYDRAEDALADWAALEAIAPAAIYQTRRWLLPWMRTIGAARGISPMLVVASDLAGQPVLFLPLGIVCSGGLKVARFLGGKDSNFNMALIAPGVAFSAANLKALLAAAARTAPVKPDLFILANQVESWEGVPNPFAALPCQPSPSFGYKGVLMRDGEAFLKARTSADARKKSHYKWRKLAAKGEMKILTPAEMPDAAPLIAAFLTQKSARFRAMGIADAFDGPVEAGFLAQASRPDAQTGERAMEWHALACGGQIAATFGGGVHRGRMHGMVTSFDTNPEIAPSSPGDLLMQKLFSAACERGLTLMDLGIGEARYKNSFCDIAEPLFDCLVPASLKGRVFAGAEAARLTLKRRIKQTPALWALVLRVRTWKALRG